MSEGKNPTMVTRGQLEVLRTVLDYKTETGISPSVHDLANRLGKSYATVHEMRRALRDKGLIAYKDRSPRSIMITAKGHEFMAEHPRSETTANPEV